MQKGFPVPLGRSFVCNVQDQLDGIESDVPSQFDKVVFIEVHHRLQFGTRVDSEFKRHPIPKVRCSRDIPAPEQVGGFREQTSVDRLEYREPTTGSENAEELRKGIAFSGDVDQNGAGGNGVDTAIADAGEILRASLHEPTVVGYLHLGRSFRAPLQQFGRDVAENKPHRVIKRVACPERDKPVAASDVEEHVPWLKVCAGEDAVAVAFQLGALVRLEITPALAAGQQPRRPRISRTDSVFRGADEVGRHGFGRHPQRMPQPSRGVGVGNAALLQAGALFLDAPGRVRWTPVTRPAS